MRSRPSPIELQGDTRLGTTVDLEHISTTLWKSWLRGKFYPCVGITAFVVGAGALSIYRAIVAAQMGNYLYPGRYDLAIAGFFLGMGGCLLWATHFVDKPASSVQVDSTGVTLSYPRHSPKRLSWADPRLKIRLSYGFHPSLDSTLAFLQFYLWKPRAFLNEDAVLAIVNSARTAGLSVRTVEDPYSSTGETLIITARAT